MGSGRISSMSCSMENSRGNTTVNNSTTVKMPKPSTNTGYETAATTSPRSSSSCSSKSAKSAITFCNTPASSPTRTMLT